MFAFLRLLKTAEKPTRKDLLYMAGLGCRNHS
jgi:hypothetical protein